jgi:hypothetical protein
LGLKLIFAIIEEILEKPAAGLPALQQKDLQTCFQQRQGCWSKYLCAKAQCLKGCLGVGYKYPFYDKLCLLSGNSFIHPRITGNKVDGNSVRCFEIEITAAVTQTGIDVGKLFI